MSDNEAGPSGRPADGATAPSTLFKKRQRKGAAGKISVETIEAEGGADHLRDTPERPLDSSAPQDDDQETSVADILTLRALTRRPVTGIELQKLNEGEKKKKKKAKDGQKAKTQDEIWAEQMQRGGLMTRAPAGADDDSDSDAEGGQGAKKPRLLSQSNFQGETGTVDVDKHMMAYIEEQLAKRRAEQRAAASGGANSGAASGAGADGGVSLTDGEVRRAILNPGDELYKIAEQYKDLQKKPITEKEEGNVTLSASMLTSIPEYDLGIETKLQNIEETERAKKALLEERQAARRNAADEDPLAAARFRRGPGHQASDSDTLRNARREAAGEAPLEHRARERKELATDQQVMERFKKRQREQMKR